MTDSPKTHSPAVNQTIETQLAHRTIRAYTNQPVGQDVVRTLLDVARSAATSNFYQAYTILQITDKKVREAIYEVSGQPYVGGSAGQLFMFVVDLSRAARIREQQGEDLRILQKSTLFLQGVQDTMIAAQNMVIAAESMGLGTVMLGSVSADPQKLIEVLQLPEYTFPLVGMLVGHPGQNPQLKPRLPLEITTAENVYPDFEADWYTDLMAEYDETIQTYYDLRDGGHPQDSFTKQMVNKPGAGRFEQSDMLGVLHKQKLCLY